MDKNKLVIGGLILIALIIIGGYLMAGRADAPSELTGTNKEDTLVDKISDAGKKSPASMMALGQSQNCTFTSTATGVQSGGTVYMSGGKMRGDFSSNVQGKVEVTHMITDGKETRIWIEGQMDGYLMTMPEPDTTTSPDTPVSSQTNSQIPINMEDDSTDYNCSPWVADASVFAAPTNVNFVSMDDMMKGAMPQTAPSSGTGQTSPGAYGGGSAGYSGGGDSAAMKAQQCAMCEQVKDPNSKSECKAAFQCAY